MKKQVLLVATIIAILSANVAHATSAKMIFWYPGEAGSTQEAKPLLDELFVFLKGKDSSLAITGEYFNTIEEGKAYIQKEKPAMGILSSPTWEKFKNDYAAARVFLATLPLPGGAQSERYMIAGVEPLSDNGLNLYMSEPLDRSYVTSKLFPKLPASIKLESTNSLLAKLKAIAEGNMKGYALLTPIEADTLGKLSAEWAKKITLREPSQPVPSARFVLFAPDYPNAEKLKNVLIEMKNDPSGKEILDSLRLTGFALP